MTYTENYQLNQWAAEDRVLRADFNADNAKLDAAIKSVEAGAASALTSYQASNDAAVAAARTEAANALAAYKSSNDAAVAALQTAIPAVRLLSVTTTSALSQIDLDVSSIGLTQYRKLELHFSGSASAYGAVGLRLNGVSSGYYSRSGTNVYDGQNQLVSFGISASSGGAQVTLHIFGQQLCAQAVGAGWGSSNMYLDDHIGGVASTAISASAVKTLNLVPTTSGVTIKAGAAVTLWGYKK